MLRAVSSVGQARGRLHLVKTTITGGAGGGITPPAKQDITTEGGVNITTEGGVPLTTES